MAGGGEGWARGAAAEGTSEKVWRWEQSTAVLEDPLFRLAGKSSCSPLNTTRQHCMCGLDVPIFLPSILHSFNQPSLVGLSLRARHCAERWGTKVRG